MIIHTFHPRSSLHFPSLPPPSLPFPSLHFSSLHVTSLHHTSLPIFDFLHFWTFLHHASKTLYFSSLILVVTFLTCFLKMYDIQGKVAIASPGSWFHSLIFLLKGVFTNIFHCSLALIWRSWSSLLRYHGPFNLFPLGFLPVFRCTLWTGRKCELSFCAAPSFLQTESLVFYKYSRFLLHTV